MTIEEFKEMVRAQNKFTRTNEEAKELTESVIKSLETLEKIKCLFHQWSNGELKDNEYYFQMQNLLVFGETLGVEVENDD